LPWALDDATVVDLGTRLVASLEGRVTAAVEPLATRSEMRMLHEDLVERIRTLGEVLAPPKPRGRKTQQRNRSYDLQLLAPSPAALAAWTVA
jgi:hypothetical protein